MIINFCLRSYPSWEVPHWLFSLEALKQKKKKNNAASHSPGLDLFEKSISVSIISLRVPAMISFWLCCVALFPFFPLSVFPICLWVSLSTKCELLFVPPNSPPLAFSPSYPLLFFRCLQARRVWLVTPVIAVRVPLDWSRRCLCSGEGKII